MAKDQAGSEPAHHPEQDDLAEEGQIDDDGGFVDDDDDEPGEDHGHQAAEEADAEKEEEKGEDTIGTGGTNDDKEEDEETAQITNELLEAQTPQAMAQSRSAERRRQHASPRRGPVIGGSGGPRVMIPTMTRLLVPTRIRIREGQTQPRLVGVVPPVIHLHLLLHSDLRRSLSLGERNLGS
ncbi:uncharacterized protein IUM83_04575 [Phytophthora cinnamomi]|uniref:uncharacterized protein n=1 Tax=Phytophthora cinnamomi TaxID=4785 RepID=UPI0035596DCF|nr:hypothetical protein IUM83_04575 [Phytophthora cinnamomi]